MHEILRGIPKSITDQMNASLTKPVTEQEIKQALFLMHPNKALGPDDISSVFFQSFWHVIGTDVVNAIQSFFFNDSMSRLLNETLISLIPKVESPSNLSHYRPISLNNVLYKIISKVLANLLKLVLGTCISKNQSAFVPEKQILDTVMLAHEYIHFLQHKRTGKEGFMALKSDMAKAYDRVDWNFIAKGLSNLLRQATDAKRITRVKVTRNGPAISHSLFADAYLNCCKVQTDEANEIMKILERYGKASGQVVDMEKSLVFYSKNTELREVSSSLSIIKGIKLVSQGFVSRDQAVLKVKLLSQAGKWVLLKFVVGAMPAYAMSVVKLLKKLCKDMTRLMANFWWGNVKEEKKMHLIKWQKVAEVKGKGGLGFRDIQHFDNALLVKQVRRIVSNPNLLVSKVLKAIYFPCSSIWEAKEKSNATWIWKNLLSSRNMLIEGLRWKVEDGNSIKIWDDRWILHYRDGRIKISRLPQCSQNLVNDLIQDSTWNKELLSSLFSKQDRQAIQKIPSILDGEDSLYWKESTTGEYTVKSSSALTVKLQFAQANRKQAEGESNNNSQHTGVWKFPWSLNIKNQIKQFLWKCLKGILPANEAMYRSAGKRCNVCQGCGDVVETTENLLFTCPKVQDAWRVFPIHWDSLKEFIWYFWGWWEQLQQAQQRAQGREHIPLTANFLWQLWKVRNK